jgi:hypothetical protein
MASSIKLAPASRQEYDPADRHVLLVHCRMSTF